MQTASSSTVPSIDNNNNNRTSISNPHLLVAHLSHPSTLTESVSESRREAGRASSVGGRASLLQVALLLIMDTIISSATSSCPHKCCHISDTTHHFHGKLLFSARLQLLLLVYVHACRPGPPLHNYSQCCPTSHRSRREHI